MPRFYVSAAHKSSGKTTVAIGLAAALAGRGLAVQPFKKGPDYIDPLWLGRAAGRPCYNLDFNTQSARDIRDLMEGRGADASLSLIEGNKGLFDGLDLEGRDSNDALARLLAAPVVLVIDCVGMTRGIAPLLLGYRDFAPDLPFAGVILNKVGGPRHESKLRGAVERYTDIPVLGAVPRDESLVIDERHLGLVPANETGAAEAHIAPLAKAMRQSVDLTALYMAAEEAPDMALPAVPQSPPPAPDLRIGYSRDAAFGFYYTDDLEAFAAAGAELVPVDTLADRALPDGLDGLFLGGGFPETHMGALAANRPLLDDLAAAVEAGLPVHAECGGLMLLGRTLTWGGDTVEMAGALPLHTTMHPRPEGRGLVRLSPTADAPWAPVPTGDSFSAHEFHYSAVSRLEAELPHAWTVERGRGIDGARDGLIHRNTIASYSHFRATSAIPWVARFVDFVRRRKAGA